MYDILDKMVERIIEQEKAELKKHIYDINTDHGKKSDERIFNIIDEGKDFITIEFKADKVNVRKDGLSALGVVVTNEDDGVSITLTHFTHDHHIYLRGAYSFGSIKAEGDEVVCDVTFAFYKKKLYEIALDELKKELKYAVISQSVR